MARLEIFPNELLFDIFEFLSTAHLLRAFLGLNSQFNRVLSAHFRNHQLNLQSIDKEHFHMICEEHLPILIDHTIALHLSNDDETPTLYRLFRSNSFTLNRFLHLQSLSLSHIVFFNTLHQIILQCRRLPCLQKLYLIDCQISQERHNRPKMINNIWSLPNLRHCVINDIRVNMTWICKVSIMTSTLEYLSIKMIEGDISALYYLCKSAPRLRQLDIDVIKWSFYNQPKILFLSLISLKTSFQGHAAATFEFLKCLPNLCSLTLEVSDFLLDGYAWKAFLVRYLPKLKTFRLKMNFNFPPYGDVMTLIDELVDSFRTVFWIEEHQWYVRCDCYLSNTGYANVLYTLPYAFNQYSYLNTYYSISTKPDGGELYSHHHVHFLDEQIMAINSFQNLQLCSIRFPNIAHLKITFPLIDHANFLPKFSFKQLTSITVALNSLTSYDQLQTCINQAPALYSLNLNSFGETLDGLFQLTSSSIRRLDMAEAQFQQGSFFNHENCINLINSPLGRQCEVLVIELENRNNILNLIEKMPHLRILIFRLKNNHPFNFAIFRSRFNTFIGRSKANPSSKMTLWISREINQSYLLDAEMLMSDNSSSAEEHSYNDYLCLFSFFVVVGLLFYTLIEVNISTSSSFM